LAHWGDADSVAQRHLLDSEWLKEMWHRASVSI
jgi:hypothetical protein